MDKAPNITMSLPKPPDLEGLVDQDILDRFKDSSVFYGDIINAQLIKTNTNQVKAIERLTAMLEGVVKKHEEEE